MKKVLLILLAFLILIASNIGCKPAPSQSVIQSEPKVINQPRIDLSATIIDGNNAYIPLNLSGVPQQNVHSILAAEKEFERTYPKLEVTYQIDAQYHAEGATAHTYGIWVHHRPKER